MWMHSSNFHRCFESRGQGVCEAGESSLVVAATAAAGATWLESLVIDDQVGCAVICSWRGGGGYLVSLVENRPPKQGIPVGL